MTPIQTSARDPLAALPDARSTHRPWRTEVIETLRLAWPMALTQLGQIAMMTTDLAMLGRLGDTVVAAASLAHTILFAAFVLGMGLVSAVAPLAAQAFGARDPEGVRRALRVGLWACVLVGAPLTLGLFWGEQLLVALGQEPTAAALAQRYLDGLAWSLIPAWVFIAVRGFMGAVNRPEPALWIMLAAVPINGLLAYGLIYGAFGLPRLELLGAGLATTLVNIVMCAVAIYIAVTRAPFSQYRIFGRFLHWDWPLMRMLLIIGGPIAGSFALEYGLFGASALLMGVIGTSELAAHQIALQTAAIMFMAPFGVSMAATVRVGQALGRGDMPGVRRAGFVALAIATIFMALMTVLVAIWREAIPTWFLGSATAQPETALLASSLLLFGACFFIFDGVQTVGAGALRGLNDTRVPLLFAAFSFWIVGIAGAYGFGFALGYGAPGIWVGLTLGLAVFAALLVWRFEKLSRRAHAWPTVAD